MLIKRERKRERERKHGESFLLVTSKRMRRRKKSEMERKKRAGAGKERAPYMYEGLAAREGSRGEMGHIKYRGPTFAMKRRPENGVEMHVMNVCRAHCSRGCSNTVSGAGTAGGREGGRDEAPSVHPVLRNCGKKKRSRKEREGGCISPPQMPDGLGRGAKSCAHLAFTRVPRVSPSPFHGGDYGGDSARSLRCLERVLARATQTTRWVHRHSPGMGKGGRRR